jgi:hypothetical protein
MTLDQEWVVLLELNEIRQPVSPAPALPTDSELYDHEAAGTSADRTIAQLETDAWTSEVTGLDAEKVQKLREPIAAAKPSRSITDVATEAFSETLGPMLKRADSVSRKRSEYHSAMIQFTHPLRKLFREITPEIETRFDRLHNAMTDAVTRAVIEGN